MNEKEIMEAATELGKRLIRQVALAEEASKLQRKQQENRMHIQQLKEKLATVPKDALIVA